MKRFFLILPSLSFLLLAACAAEVGDSCSSSADCGTNRVCVTSYPGGYCSKSPCERNGCPDEAVCIEFDDGSAYCMKHCANSGDCRGGDYTCVEDFGDHPFCGLLEEEEQQ